jgi:myosin heavy subunit
MLSAGTAAKSKFVLSGSLLARVQAAAQRQQSASRSRPNFTDRTRSVLREGSDVWYPDGAGDSSDFRKGKVVAISDNGSKVTVSLENGVQKEFVRALIGLIPNMKALNAEGHEMEVEVEDLTLLSDVHEGVVMGVLHDRYMKDAIFTYIGSSVLVSVNPFKDLGDNTSSTRRRYVNREQGELPPHIYAFADRSLRALVANNESQSIIVSGESGAGKTEACKLVMNFLSEACSGSGSSASGQLVEQLMKKIISTNPVLEAFGNAKTLRNNNSSRFGKFLQIDFSAGGSPTGACQRVYLLEKSRIVSQNQMERNFHIFYQLCAGASPQQKVLHQPCFVHRAYSYFVFLSI